MARTALRGQGGLLPPEWHAILEQEKLAALAEFAAGAGHEINNPLGVIVGRAQLLLRQESNVERRRDLSIIATQAMRIHEMIADLMLFARPPKPQRARADLTWVVRQACDELRSRAELQATQLILVSSQAVSGMVDATQIVIVVRALIDNALEALGRDGRVELTVSSLRLGRVRCGQITVRDTGPGISEAVRRHLFDPFFSGRQAGRGLGTGLAKAWRIVTLHGGTIIVESTPTEGTTFTITLPLSAKHQLHVDPASALRVNRPHLNRRVPRVQPPSRGAKSSARRRAKPSATTPRGKSRRSRPGSDSAG